MMMTVAAGTGEGGIRICWHTWSGSHDPGRMTGSDERTNQPWFSFRVTGVTAPMRPYYLVPDELARSLKPRLTTSARSRVRVDFQAKIKPLGLCLLGKKLCQSHKACKRYQEMVKERD
ncbi:hypothetical protein GGTG_06459 [Gaeumannomyces tritici R3-111a-1]|uniref:Uncharacterized protein n=1 Tax=Gaeumannomyces tritici (strain R3-111a-1) TaxID=644352 RepID=J3NYV7_GAET3|nr:hypothetical protein GGTG_06459 [Gaeumannomyces tritici R3-111a-1]EJT76540.1 hypothetical protein GGTG_06459 [Gaeumannomyces tritici R3-111a-1]